MTWYHQTGPPAMKYISISHVEIHTHKDNVDMISTDAASAEVKPTPRPKSLKAAGAPRPSTAKHRKPHRRPNQAIAMQKRWADPAFRAKQIAGRQRTALDRARHPEKYSRVGIPNGMRKSEAQALWDKASTLADAAMERLAEQGVVERVTVPDTDDDIAKKALREAFELAFGPGNARDRLAAARLVLTYTKPRPPTVAETHDLLTAHPDTERLMAALLGSPHSLGTQQGRHQSLSIRMSSKKVVGLCHRRRLWLRVREHQPSGG